MDFPTDDFVLKLRVIESELLADLRSLKADERLNEERLAVVRRALAEAEDLAQAGGGAVGLGDGDAAGGSRVPGDEGDVFLVPKLDPETHEPIYDSRVVAGKRSHRLRAYAAARVYGPSLREVSLAAAIFETGETRAVDAGSVRSSMGGLIRHGVGTWKRDKGWLLYLGELTPDLEFIRLLFAEMTEGPAWAS